MFVRVITVRTLLQAAALPVFLGQALGRAASVRRHLGDDGKRRSGWGRTAARGGCVVLSGLSGPVDRVGVGAAAFDPG